jgi:tape measure domain-containing protein
MATERVGALRYDVVLNTHSMKKGASDARSALKTFRDGMKSATTATERYQAGMENVKKLFKDKSITKEQGATLVRELNKELEKEGFRRTGINKFEKTKVKLLQEELELQKKINREAELRKKIEAEKNKTDSRHLSDFRNRKRKSHSEIMDRALQMRRVNARSHQLVMLNMRQRMRFMSTFSPGMAAGVAGNLAGALGASGQTIGAVRGAAMLGAKLAVPAAGFIALGLAMKKAVAEADRLKKITLDLSVLLGGSDQSAKKLVGRFQALARETPLATAQLAEGARQLLAFGRESRFVEEDLRRLGTIAGGDTERMRLLTKAFADVTAAGKLQGQELRQFTNQGFNPLREMVEMTGKSYGKLRKEMELGMISADMVADSMAAATERYAGRLEQAMNTVAAQYEKFKGIMSEIFAEGGGPAQEVVVDMMKGMNNIILGAKEMADDTVVQMKKAGEDMAELAQDIGVMFTKDVFEEGAFKRTRKNIAEAFGFGEEEAKGSGITKESILADQERAGLDEKITKLIEKRIELLADEDAKLLKVQRELNNIKEIDTSIAEARTVLNKAIRHGGETGIRNAKENLRLVEKIKEKQDQQQELKDRRKREIEHENNLFKSKKKTIDDIRKRKEEDAKKEFQDAQKLAELARKAGGPSDDFTAAGTDYKFVQQRRGELEAKKLEEQANKKRESMDEERNTLISKMLEILDLNHTEMLDKLQAVN